MSKLKDILRIGTTVAGTFAPGAVGSVFEIVAGQLGNATQTSPPSVQSVVAISNLARKVDELEHAVLILHERLAKLESK